jgi:O-antigen ligase
MRRRSLHGPLVPLPGAAPAASGSPVAPVRERPLKPAALILIVLWVVAVYSPQWLIAAYGPNVVLKVQVLLFPLLAAALLLEVPTVPALSRRWQWYAPMLALILLGMATLPTALNNGYAREAIQQYLLYWILIVGTVTLVDSARRIELLLLMYGLSFVWWGLWGGTRGLVRWQPSLANYDGYGAIMVGGVGLCAFLYLSAKKGWFKKAMIAATGLSLFGVVSSFARGAFLGAVAIYLLVWVRSPRKGAMTMGGLAAVGLIVVTANMLHPGQFWAEIQSTFTEGTSEGTGEDRWELWKAGFKVFQQRPIVGVGMRNFGPFAAGFFKPGDMGGMYERNPGILYNRSLHSVYVQFLSETGVVGTAFFFWMLVHFWRRNVVLRTPEAETRWRELGGRLRLKTVALGLEASMAGFLVTAIMYPMLNVHWFFTTVALNLTLHARITESGPLHPVAARRGRRRPALMAVPPGGPPG